MSRENLLQRQAKSRENLSKAVADYVNLRAADGGYDTVVRATDSRGRKVSVFVTLNIISDEG